MSFEDSERLFEGTGYEEEDASSTTGRELRGWYSYAIAAEVFAVVGVGTCRALWIPDAGVLRSCFYTVIKAMFILTER